MSVQAIHFQVNGTNGKYIPLLTYRNLSGKYQNYFPAQA
jgi:hypothetical protein